MRIRPARTAARSGIGSTTVLRSRTTRPASFAVSVVKLDIWLVTVQTVGEDKIGVTMTVVLATPAGLPTLLKANWMPS
jgi:hypothetical protein